MFVVCSLSFCDKAISLVATLFLGNLHIAQATKTSRVLVASISSTSASGVGCKPMVRQSCDANFEVDGNASSEGEHDDDAEAAGIAVATVEEKEEESKDDADDADDYGAKNSDTEASTERCGKRRRHLTTTCSPVAKSELRLVDAVLMRALRSSSLHDVQGRAYLGGVFDKGAKELRCVVLLGLRFRQACLKSGGRPQLPAVGTELVLVRGAQLDDEPELGPTREAEQVVRSVCKVTVVTVSGVELHETRGFVTLSVSLVTHPNFFRSRVHGVPRGIFPF